MVPGATVTASGMTDIDGEDDHPAMGAGRESGGGVPSTASGSSVVAEGGGSREAKAVTHLGGAGEGGTASPAAVLSGRVVVTDLRHCIQV